MDIVKGKQYTVSTKFMKRGSPAVFVQPPAWVLYNSDDQELIQGAASSSGSLWGATFTIPTTYVVPNGKEELLLQFSGYDNKNSSFINDKTLTLIDNTEEFKPDGVIYNIMTNRAIKDSIALPGDTADLKITILDPQGHIIGVPVVINNQSASSTNSKGYNFNFTIPPLNIATNPFLDPHQIMIEYTSDSEEDTELHPLYILDMRMLNNVNTLDKYLDKAKLDETDPALRWSSQDLAQATLHGYKHINSSPPTTTYWNSSSLPSSMDQYLFWASAFFALNSRFLAEGLQSFDFSGLNTQLNYNRTDPLSAKMSELQGLLERLADAKKSAVSSGGVGTPLPGEIDQRVMSAVRLGLSGNLLNNRRTGRFPFLR